MPATYTVTSSQSYGLGPSLLLFILSLPMDSHLGVWPRAAPAFFNVSEAAIANLSQSVAATLHQVTVVLGYEGSYLKKSLVDIIMLTMFFGMRRDHV